jgi:hypothetical protein
MEGLMAVSYMQGGFKYQVLHYEWSIWFDNDGPHNCGSLILLSSLKIHWKYGLHVGLFIHFIGLCQKLFPIDGHLLELSSPQKYFLLSM